MINKGYDKRVPFFNQQGKGFPIPFSFPSLAIKPFKKYALNLYKVTTDTSGIKGNTVVRVVSTQLNINGRNQIPELHMTIQLNKITDFHNSLCQPFGTGLALKNLDPFTAFAEIMCKAKKIKTPARFAPLAVQVYHPRLVRM